MYILCVRAVGKPETTFEDSGIHDTSECAGEYSSHLEVSVIALYVHIIL